MVTTKNFLRYLSLAGLLYFGGLSIGTGLECVTEQDKIKRLPTLFERNEEIQLSNENQKHRIAAAQNFGMCVGFGAVATYCLASFSRLSNKKYLSQRVNC